MPLIPFPLLPGVNSDDTTFKKQARVCDASLMRTRLLTWETIGGWGSPSLSIGDRARNIFSWNAAGTVMVAYGTPLQIKTATGTGSATNRLSPAVHDVAQWSFGAWGDHLLAMPSGSAHTGKLLVWTGSGNASAVSTSPPSANVMLPVHTRQVMMLGTNRESGGAFDGLCGRVSDIEDYSDWTTAPASNAGEFILEGRDPIVAALEVDKTVYAWSRSALYRIDYFGSDGWVGNKLADITGPRHKNAVALLGDTMFWVGTDFRWRYYSPVEGVVEMGCPLTREIDDYSESTNETHFMGVINRHEEVWFFYGDKRDGGYQNDCTRAIVFSKKESELAGEPIWFKHQLNRTAMHDAGPTGLLMCDPSGTVSSHELANSIVTGWYLQTGDFYLAERNRRVYLDGFVNDFESFTGNVVQLRFYARDWPQETFDGLAQTTTVTHGPYALTAGGAVLAKVDFRISGMVIAARISGSSGGSQVRFGAPQLRLGADQGGDR